MIDLVLGCAKGYNAEEVRPFLRTLRKVSGYKGRVVWFASGGCVKEAKKWGVEVRPCPPTTMKIHANRFLWCLDALWDIKCEGVLLADTRDVIFQNVLSQLSNEGLHTYEEDKSMTIGTCPYNSLWVKLAYGQKGLEKLGSLPISCVGVSHGDRRSVLQYLELLVGEILRVQPKTNKPQDQAAHNFVVREMMKEAVVYPNEEGECYTVGYVPPGKLELRGRVAVNKAGLVPTIVHQWERKRHSRFKQLVERSFL